MRSSARMTASSALGGLVLLCLPWNALAQGAPQIHAVTHIASLAPGSIQGTVLDEKGAPVVGAMVSALGTQTSFAVSDRGGRFELRTLTPGAYLVRAHLSGFVASRGQLVDVRPSARTSSSIALRHASPVASTASYPVLAAGMGAPSTEATPQPADAGGTTEATGTTDDHGEIAWRLRHARRGILRDATLPGELLAGDEPGAINQPDFFDRSSGSPTRLAANFFAGTPFSGQVNLLTTGSFDSPQQLFKVDTPALSL